MKENKTIREVKIENNTLQFLFRGAIENDISCNTGSAYVTNTYFSSEYPNSAEIERALENIEIEFSKHKELRNNNETLICNNSVLAEMLSVEEETVISRNILEEVFNKYIDCACGEPAHILGIDYSVEKLSLIILVRTIMYYLGFNEITVSK
ncbi:hypothetical protein [Saccharicrinis aurantiacus]|uniref:hypothetical protein n=1 Tax=Saccharicrinis aurantiacus TaxID=1849719 RepID=UPI00248F758F|nr:hypothetical protein [Saccharicrinis aurantiacus]